MVTLLITLVIKSHDPLSKGSFKGIMQGTPKGVPLKESLNERVQDPFRVRSTRVPLSIALRG